MSITASQVKELRELTGAGMMECKKALVETSGSIEEAITLMRTRGQSKAAKKAGRVAAEGIIAIKTSDDNKRAAMVEINSETDFVARDENFLKFAGMVVAKALETQVADAEALLQTTSDGSKTIEESRQELIAKIGENVNVRRCKTIESTTGVSAYQHGSRIGVLVVLDNENADIGKDIAMHIAASNPQVISADEVPADVIAKEKEIYIAQAMESGKPKDIAEKMVAGRLKKFTGEVSLLGQPFVKDPSVSVEQFLKNAKVNVTNFARYAVGEGIEKEEVDFAEEVMAQAHGDA